MTYPAAGVVFFLSWMGKDDFFVGIGDINEPIYAASNAVKKFESPGSASPQSVTSGSILGSSNLNGDGGIDARINTCAKETVPATIITDAELVDLESASVAGGGGTNGLDIPAFVNEKLLAQMQVVQQHVLDEQQKDRPLARRQSLSDYAMQEDAETTLNSLESGSASICSDNDVKQAATTTTTTTAASTVSTISINSAPVLQAQSPPLSPSASRKPRRPLLRDDDIEVFEKTST
jgi:hypothetical protein